MDIERLWLVGARNPLVRWAHDMFSTPTKGHSFGLLVTPPSPRGELVVGQWALIPWFAKGRKLKYPTWNARSKELSKEASYKHPWARGQQYAIPVSRFFEPCWETGKHIPRGFTRQDGEPCMGPGRPVELWPDLRTVELVESYARLTSNADMHPLMNRMHKPDLKRPMQMQGKPSVVPIELKDVDTWLYAPEEEAAKLVTLAPVEAFVGVVVVSIARLFVHLALGRSIVAWSMK